jgi:O-antigen/teichoic acid export membrane protein
VFQKLRQLFTHLAIYGLGDVVTSIVSFLLLPIYVRFLSPADYGVIGLLLSVEVVAKVIFRWGVDASFMRLYYEAPATRDRQTLASTIVMFMLAINGGLLAVALIFAPVIASHLFGSPEYALLLRLVLINTFVVGFYFIPFHVMRIQGEATRFVSLTFSRSAATLIARLVLVIFAGFGVLGVVLADLLVTGIFTILMTRWFAPLLRPRFSWPLLRGALRFGLPRLPHGIAYQAVLVADRYLLSVFATLRDVGLYSIGASFGLALKLFLSAFEYAWAPFYYATMKEPDAKRTFATVTTYGVGALILLTAGLAAVSRDVVRVMTTAEFYEAARVVPWIAIGVLLQGIYLLTSIGLNITKRTEYYPVATALAAATSIGANLVLIPRFGMMGAAWANVLSYGVLAAVSMTFSQRVYPIQYEWGRIARLAAAGFSAFAIARIVLPAEVTPAIGLLVRGAIVVLVYPLVLAATGFFEPRETARLRRLLQRVRPIRRPAATADTAELAGEIVGTPLDTTTNRDAEISERGMRNGESSPAEVSSLDRPRPVQPGP